MESLCCWSLKRSRAKWYWLVRYWTKENTKRNWLLYQWKSSAKWPQYNLSTVGSVEIKLWWKWCGGVDRTTGWILSWKSPVIFRLQFQWVKKCQYFCWEWWADIGKFLNRFIYGISVMFLTIYSLHTSCTVALHKIYTTVSINIDVNKSIPYTSWRTCISRINVLLSDGMPTLLIAIHLFGCNVKPVFILHSSFHLIWKALFQCLQIMIISCTNRIRLSFFFPLLFISFNFKDITLLLVFYK